MQQSKTQVRSINTGGAPGVWRVLDAVESRECIADVWCIQELRMSKEEFGALENKFASARYYLHHQPGKPTTGSWGEDKALGGVMVAVAKRLKQRLVSVDEQGVAQRVSVEVQGCCPSPPAQAMLPGRCATVRRTEQAQTQARPRLSTHSKNRVDCVGVP